MKRKQPADDPAAMLRAIRSHCLDCMGGSREQVAKCAMTRCSLNPYRMGAGEASRYHEASDGKEGMQLSMLEMRDAV